MASAGPSDARTQGGGKGSALAPTEDTAARRARCRQQCAEPRREGTKKGKGGREEVIIIGRPEGGRREEVVIGGPKGSIGHVSVTDGPEGGIGRVTVTGPSGR